MVEEQKEREKQQAADLRKMKEHLIGEVDEIIQRQNRILPVQKMESF